MIRVVGIDPGLVHTGAVRFNFDTVGKRFALDYQVFEGGEDYSGPNLMHLVDWWGMYPANYTFIEDYRRRASFHTDPSMMRIVSDIRGHLSESKTLNNMGVKKVVTRDLMELFGAWTFPLRTHHQDLRSAARIGLFGMLKNERLNKVVYEYVTDSLEGRPWREMKGAE